VLILNNKTFTNKPKVKYSVNRVVAYDEGKCPCNICSTSLPTHQSRLSHKPVALVMQLPVCLGDPLASSTDYHNWKLSKRHCCPSSSKVPCIQPITKRRPADAAQCTLLLPKQSNTLVQHPGTVALLLQIPTTSQERTNAELSMHQPQHHMVICQADARRHAPAKPYQCRLPIAIPHDRCTETDASSHTSSSKRQPRHNQLSCGFWPQP
jgi:hypothetical protein